MSRNPVSIEIVDEALASLGVRGIYLAEHYRCATFGPWPGAPAFRLMVEAHPDRPVLVVRGLPSVAYSPEERPELLAACNEWHVGHRWPRLVVVERDEMLLLEADLQVPCRQGLTSEQVAEVISTFVSAAREAWEQFSGRTDPAAGLLDGLSRMLADAAVGAGPEPPAPDETA